MKQIAVFFIIFLTNLSFHAHQNMCTVTITVGENKKQQISVDGRNYDPDKNTTAGDKPTIRITDLEMGQHMLKVISTNQETKKPDSSSAVFNLRYGYNMKIRLDGSGITEFVEIKRRGTPGSQLLVTNKDLK